MFVLFVLSLWQSSPAAVMAFQVPRQLPPVATRINAEKTHQEYMADLMAREHELTLRTVAEARASVRSEYASRIAELEEALSKASSPPSSSVKVIEKELVDPVTAVSAPSQELHYLEYSELPLNKVGKKDPLAAKVRSVTRAIGPSAPGEICHVVMDTKGDLPYVEGQSVGVLPPGIDDKGRAHQQRLYSIASSRYGDDGAGVSVSLCVRRAVYVDPDGKEDPAKKGVCSNFLCDSKPGDQVLLTGPVGKGMLLPDDEEADLIMVATGTGVAPFRGFVQRLFVERTPAAAAYRGRAWLFLGGPTTSSLLYPDLWKLAKEKRPYRFDATFAVSREQSNPDGSRCYVQHRIKENADEVFKRIEGGAHVYFCGLKGMMPGIEETFQQACADRNLDYKTWMKDLKSKKRWHVEVY